MGLLERMRDEGLLPRKPKQDAQGRTIIGAPGRDRPAQLALVEPASTLPAPVPLAAYKRVGLPVGWVVRSLIARPTGDGALTVTLKVTDTDGRRFYRHGVVTDILAVGSLTHRWIDEGYWTPDKQ